MSPIFDRDAAENARDDGMERSEEHANSVWKIKAMLLIRQVCLANEEFTAEDVWAAGLESPREPRAIGPMLATATRKGWCEMTDRVRPSKMVSNHARPQAIRKSLIYSKPAPPKPAQTDMFDNREVYG